MFALAGMVLRSRVGEGPSLVYGKRVPGEKVGPDLHVANGLAAQTIVSRDEDGRDFYVDVGGTGKVVYCDVFARLPPSE